MKEISPLILALGLAFRGGHGRDGRPDRVVLKNEWDVFEVPNSLTPRDPGAVPAGWQGTTRNMAARFGWWETRPKRRPSR